MVPPEDALDVTQEAFYLAMRGIATFKPGHRFSTWLFAIAKNRCFDFMRRRKKVRIEEYDEVERPQPDNQALDPAGLAARDELARAVNRTLMELSPSTAWFWCSGTISSSPTRRCVRSWACPSPA